MTIEEKADEMISIQDIHLTSKPGLGNMVVLKEEPEARRYFTMFVGDSGFAAIAKEKGLLEADRLFTHEFYLRILDKLQVDFLRIEIYDMRESNYYAKVIFKINGKTHKVESRPSDAIALALNKKIPIMVKQRLFHRELSQEEIAEYEGIVKIVRF